MRTPQVWKPKAPLASPSHNDGEFPCGVTAPDPDFDGIGLAALESKLGRFVTSSADWPCLDSPEILSHWHDRSLLSDRQTPHEAQWDQTQHHVRLDIEPWIMRYMDNSPAPFSADLLNEAPTSLSLQGSSKHMMSPRGRLEHLVQTKDGHQKETQSYWGKVVRRGDFADQELHIDFFHFEVIDFG